MAWFMLGTVNGLVIDQSYNDGALLIFAWDNKVEADITFLQLRRLSSLCVTSANNQAAHIY